MTLLVFRDTDDDDVEVRRFGERGDLDGASQLFVAFIFVVAVAAVSAAEATTT